MPAEDLQAENEELRRRLEEAEDTLRAIRSGDVDAVVVEQPDGHRIYTLESADKPYRLFVEEMQQGAATLHTDGTIAWCNKRLAELLKVPLEKLIGAALSEFIAPQDRTAFDNLLWQGQSRSGRGEANLQRPDGSLVPAYLTFNALPKDCGAVIGVLVTDLTTQRHHEQLTAAHEALRTSEERFRMLFDHGPVAVYSCDTSGLIREFNRRAADLWGRAPQPGDTDERFCGSFKMFRPDGTYMPHDRCPMAEVLTGAITHVHEGEVHIERPDGSRVIVVVAIRPLKNEQGEITGAINCFYDITERKRLEDELRQYAAELSEADHRKDEFLATLAHELRNPLAPISNSLEIMKRDRGNAELVEQARITMERQMGQMVRLIDDLLDVSRISQGKIALRQERVELASLIYQAVEMCRPAIECAKHNLTVSLPKQPVYLRGDGVRLAQIFSNLLNNACKYSEPEGRIALTAERQGSDVLVSVKDSGIGIPGEMLPKIFELFTQVDRSLERSQGGLGIGLTLVKKLVELHGGTVEAKSAGLGHGSEFIVRLPLSSHDLAAAAHAPTIHHSRPTTHSAPRRILIVDDNRDAAKSLAMLLKLSGHETLTASDGLEALEAAATFRPEVVLLDIGLPKLNGYEVARCLRKEPWGGSLLLVALTGWGQEDDRRKSSEAGFDAHLVKPVDLATLVQMLESAPAAMSAEA